MKTIFITSFHPFVSRNIIHTVAIKLADSKDMRVVVLIPSYKRDFFEETFKNDNLIIEGIDFKNNRRSLSNRVFRNIFYFLQDTETVNSRFKEAYLNNNKYLSYFFHKIISLFSDSNFLINILRKLDFIFSKSNIFLNVFNKYSPDLVFSTDIFSEDDVFLLRESIKYNTPTLGMVRSWDNPTTKGICRIIPNNLIVQNGILKKEMINIHKFKENKIFISGVPHYDMFFNFKPSKREDFFKKIDLGLNKRLIIFSPAGDKFTDIDYQILEILKEAKAKELIPKDVQFLIKCHPTNYVSEDKIFSSEGFFVERPGIEFGKGGYGRRELDWETYMHLGDSIYYADILINILSTIGIETAIFNKPLLTIGFDGKEKRDYYNSVKRFHDDSHMKIFLNTGVSKIARSREELIEFINMYLKNPNLDEGGRKKAVSSQCWDIKGNSTNRLVNYIKNII